MFSRFSLRSPRLGGDSLYERLRKNAGMSTSSEPANVRVGSSGCTGCAACADFCADGRCGAGAGAGAGSSMALADTGAAMVTGA